MKGMTRSPKVAGATKLGKLNKPPAQGKVKGITTPFSNRIMKGGR